MIYYKGMFCGSQYKINKSTVHAVDLDGTLAHTMEPYDPKRIGPPLYGTMLRQVMRWIKKGEPVVILTARMSSDHTPLQLEYTRTMIKQWTKRYLGKALPCTAEKHSSMKDIYDDRNVVVEHNTGRIIRNGKSR